MYITEKMEEFLERHARKLFRSQPARKRTKAAKSVTHWKMSPKNTKR